MPQDPYLPPGCNSSDIPGNSKKDIFIEKYLDTHADTLLDEFITNTDNEECIENIIIDASGFDEFLMHYPDVSEYNKKQAIPAFKDLHRQDYYSIIELSLNFQLFADRKASDAWYDLCEYKHDMRRHDIGEEE